MEVEDLDVHRLRFLDLKPKAITCLAFNSSSNHLYLAVGRSNSSIEIWRYAGYERQFYPHMTIPGREDTSVESLIWCHDRLLSAGLTGFIYEWTTSSFHPVQSADAMGSAIWCMDSNSDKTMLAVGCDDGKVCLYELLNGALSYFRTLDKQESRILSISWQPATSLIAIGCADSTIRVLDSDTGHCTLRITLDKVGSHDTLIWDVKFLSDRTIISASSVAKIHFWNSRFGTLKQSFNLHVADVLTLAVNESEDIIFAAGSDHKIVRLKKVSSDGSQTWVQAQDIRPHTHDVKALVVSKNGILASGGVDTQLCLNNIEKFEQIPSIKHSPFANWHNQFKLASSGNIFLFQDTTSLKLWKITSTTKHDSHTSTDCSPDKDALRSINYHKYSTKSFKDQLAILEKEHLLSSGLPFHFLEIKTSTPKHLLASAISSNASVLAFSDVDEMWLYGLNISSSHSAVCIGTWALPACSVGFNGDGSDIALGLVTGGIQVASLDNPLMKGVDIQFKNLMEKQKKGNMFVNLQYSPCGQYLAAMNDRYRIVLFGTSSYQLITTLPCLDNTFPPTFTFEHSKLLIFTSQDQELYSHDIKKENLMSLGRVYHQDFNVKRNGCMSKGLLTISTQPGVCFVYDKDALIFIKYRGKSGCKHGSEDVRLGKKRKFNSRTLSHYHVEEYKDLVFVGVLQCGELIVVEKPWTDVLSILPPTIQIDRYGT